MSYGVAANLLAKVPYRGEENSASTEDGGAYHWMTVTIMWIRQRTGGAGLGRVQSYVVQYPRALRRTKLLLPWERTTRFKLLSKG